MQYPVYEKGREIGTLNMWQQGLYTLLEASLPKKQGLYRLWLIGQDGNYCLGLLEPTDSGRYIRRSLSREAARRLPRNIEYALCTESKAVFRLRNKNKSDFFIELESHRQRLLSVLRQPFCSHCNSHHHKTGCQAQNSDDKRLSVYGISLLRIVFPCVKMQ